MYLAARSRRSTGGCSHTIPARGSAPSPRACTSSGSRPGGCGRSCEQAVRCSTRRGPTSFAPSSGGWRRARARARPRRPARASARRGRGARRPGRRGRDNRASRARARASDRTPALAPCPLERALPGAARSARGCRRPAARHPHTRVDRRGHLASRARAAPEGCRRAGLRGRRRRAARCADQGEAGALRRGARRSAGLCRRGEEASGRARGAPGLVVAEERLRRVAASNPDAAVAAGRLVDRERRRRARGTGDWRPQWKLLSKQAKKV